jgi:hypothetical protein
MQYIWQKYNLYTCRESAQSGPPIVCFHLKGLSFEWRYCKALFGLQRRFKFMMKVLLNDFKDTMQVFYA